MKKISHISLIILVWMSSFGILYADSQYNEFVRQSDSLCRFNEENQNLLKVDDPPYMSYLDPNLDSNFNEYLERLKVNASLNPEDTPFKKATIVYKETINQMFNCAMLNSKLKIWEKILNKLSKNDSESNILKSLKNQNTNIKQLVSDNWCRDFPETDTNTNFKVILLDNAFRQNCIYRHYLNYMDNYLKNNINVTFAKNSWKPLDSKTTSDLIKKSTTDIDSEIIHSNNTLKQALVWYSEFENTYWIHVLLLFIYDDFIKMRNNLNKFLNPLSQLYYKIPQAQWK
ncbi:MAG: hypothetical protein ACD_4C00441G0006 [uncultured bacterium (gcode 4)]|uniref:Uncharacterized protein n=1 Tax=uncultured bacterium (gcode 4) TaxID=1234023 RepID=K2FT89_9BACT|nr:MAG: hypothetical protein ACD_4C00441G0006 [uncultured bacterium (gcode 4)]